jgi:Nucleotidyl transferase AbiEii toxin, Type IV TA system
MSASFDPRLDILPESQLRLWPELDTVPSDFILYGGTGLALQLGHRASEDFDFFSSSGFEPDHLRSRLPFFRDLNPKDPETWVHQKRDNLEAFVNRGGLVKVAFFGGLDTLQRVEDPQQGCWVPRAVASLVDLAGMKMRVIQVRGNWKDYVDIHALASHGIDLPTALAATKAIDTSFDPATSIRALQFYGDGTLDRISLNMRQDLTRWAQAVNLGKLPRLRPRRGLSPGGMER